jgi:hypothetical protein
MFSEALPENSRGSGNKEFTALSFCIEQHVACVFSQEDETVNHI